MEFGIHADSDAHQPQPRVQGLERWGGGGGAKAPGIAHLPQQLGEKNRGGRLRKVANEQDEGLLGGLGGGSGRGGGRRAVGDRKQGLLAEERGRPAHARLRFAEPSAILRADLRLK